jgi:hypothetical protein
LRIGKLEFGFDKKLDLKNDKVLSSFVEDSWESLEEFQTFVDVPCEL